MISVRETVCEPIRCPLWFLVEPEGFIIMNKIQSRFND